MANDNKIESYLKFGTCPVCKSVQFPIQDTQTWVNCEACNTPTRATNWAPKPISWKLQKLWETLKVDFSEEIFVCAMYNPDTGDIDSITNANNAEFADIARFLQNKARKIIK